MKTIKLFFLCIAGLAFASCNDDFMQQIPETSVTTEGFFKSVSDLQVYVNGFYDDKNLYSEGWYQDDQSDNVTINTNENEMFRWALPDLRLVENADGWDDWESLRSVNVMLASLDDVAGSEADINHYVGIARYFRAWFYIRKIQHYSEVPWIDRPLTTTDELLYQAQQPRDETVRHIFEDLDYAAAHVKADMGNKTRVHRYCALALISRFALYEATYRKYHPELNLASTAGELLQRSVAASEELMNSGQFEITGAGTTDLSGECGTEGVVGALGFRSLFTSLDLSSNREIIHWRNYKVDQTEGNMSQLLMTTSSSYYSLSRSLQESFLTRDGRPYSTVTGYDRKTFTEVFADRDPRFAETFAYPGIYADYGAQKEYHTFKPLRGGYDLGKYFLRVNNRETTVGPSLGTYNGLPIYRYAEILLNYAEAKAELGQLTAEVIDKTVNRLRSRVGMPAFNAAREVDETLRSLYPNVTDASLLALRRERRVELAGEGFRREDIFRWYAGKTMELKISKQGIYVPSLPYVYDYSGDGVPDAGIAASSSAKTDDNVQWYYLNSNPFYLENGSSGFIRNTDDQNRHFDEPKDYYRPIPLTQTILNPNLKQPYGW